MSYTTINIHHSQYPENIQRDLVDSLRSRKVNHKFHYESVKQAAKWLALHEAFSPARSDSTCADAYENAFKTVDLLTRADTGRPPIQLIGLGCGGGQKEAALIHLLKDTDSSTELNYHPVDVSVPLVLSATNAASSFLNRSTMQPFVCDLEKADELAEYFSGKCDTGPAVGERVSTIRIVTFFGLIPNSEPDVILPKLSATLRGGDLLLFSANLAPGENYSKTVERVLPQYDNALTRDWLMTLLLDLGVEGGDGTLQFGMERGAGAFLRIVANFTFKSDRAIRIYNDSVNFRAGECVRVFFSYRYQERQIRELLAQYGMSVIANYSNQCGEEGVFVCVRE